MKSLIVVRYKNGVIGRCDSRCYNAKRPKCVCICGGKNHGVGLLEATKNPISEKDIARFLVIE